MAEDIHEGSYFKAGWLVEFHSREARVAETCTNSYSVHIRFTDGHRDFAWVPSHLVRIISREQPEKKKSPPTDDPEKKRYPLL